MPVLPAGAEREEVRRVSEPDRGQYRGLIVSIVLGALAIYILVVLVRVLF